MRYTTQICYFFYVYVLGCKPQLKFNLINMDTADDKSDISAFTTKTTKSKGGKALDKHCSVYKKTISGANWNKHVVKVHKGA